MPRPHPNCWQCPSDMNLTHLVELRSISSGQSAGLWHTLVGSLHTCYSSLLSVYMCVFKWEWKRGRTLEQQRNILVSLGGFVLRREEGMLGNTGEENHARTNAYKYINPCTQTTLTCSEVSGAQRNWKELEVLPQNIWNLLSTTT